MKSKDRLGKRGGVTHFRQKASGQLFKDDVDGFPSSLANFASCSVPFEVVYVPFNDQKSCNKRQQQQVFLKCQCTLSAVKPEL
jgi:hypothetical protein